MKFDAYDKLSNMLVSKSEYEKQQKELEEAKEKLQEKSNNESSGETILLKQNFEVRGIKIYRGSEGTVYLKENDKKL